MKAVAQAEHRSVDCILEGVAKGSIAIPANPAHVALRPCGVGHGLRTKVNVNLGISGDIQNAPEEWEKVRIAQEFLDVVQAHAEDGVDFMTIHAGFNRSVLDTLLATKRLTNVVSRGGSLLFAWMMTTGDEVLRILHDHDVTISLGDALRAGSNYDATDASEVAELVELGKLTTRAWEAGVQVVVEGPGHMSLDEIPANMKLQKRLCHDAPFYVLGPLVTDIAPEYDHKTASIAKGIPGARDIDNRMSDARRRVDWDGMFDCAIDPDRAREIIAEAPPEEDGTCTCAARCAQRARSIE